MKFHLFPIFVALLGASIASLHAQKRATPAGEAPGPWILGTIGVGKQPDGTMTTTALKGIAIKVGENGEAAVAYDLDLCRMAGAWTGKFTTPMNLMSRGDFPTAMGEVAFHTDAVPGYISGDKKVPWKDSRPEPFGPLPQGQARFKGFYVNGDKTILKWDIAGTEVLEMPGYEVKEGIAFFTRTFEIAATRSELRIPLFTTPWKEGEAVLWNDAQNRRLESQSYNEGGKIIEAILSAPGGGPPYDKRKDYLYQVTNSNGTCMLRVQPEDRVRRFQVRIWSGARTDEQKSIHTYIENALLRPEVFVLPDLTALTKGGPARWPDTATTTGEVSSKADEAYVVDTIKLPDPNPWNAPMFVGGFDFFPDGRAAICTFHGDVFIVSGIDDRLEHVTWKRFASGLYHALGLKIVNGEIHVTCRDGLWRLHDLNGDGECDFYEAFNHDVMVTKSFHEFVFDLQTDPAGNFYFAKAGPVKNGGRGFDEICAHHGSMFRVSPDGKKFDVIATGFRAPNGIGCGPHGELTSGDNEGTWTPVCKINWIKAGGFYGVVPLAHRDPPPTDYDRPLCWLPKRVDNSGGDQVWVTSDKWGPWKDQLLHLSYGTCSVFGVLKEEVQSPANPRLSTINSQRSTLLQGGVVRFPLNFQSGIMRARFNPKDGQLYVAGLRGWQTTGVKNAAFQRVRYTGAPVRMPIGLHATKRGVKLDFTCPLDPATASDPQNWNVEVWNYIWSGAYGSPEISTLDANEKPGELGKDGEAQFSKTQMAQKKHDPLTVKSVNLSADKKSVFLEIPDLKPVMQMAIKFGIQSADGAELRSEVVNTIHALAAE